ncbi:MAG: hypothetical protein A3A65_04270 [Candidatus Chisholmbacteria bacterium RIFCSPLOWO2_01_FULL_49_14]|uniref:Uncharacterized protein n=1 Tax=Candidatus Chisholmbacteria bacterium RIFCSPLOWO2_01_FULL_49_14 TaxID=1797593 RepID=A0A1G1VV62_9BACT|nr:MAG: hypothetical protein A3A65_04270 [Candidatus Chisholmbacteria bacterium RIFCSPLOWO2_01_FULL_49_14]
MMNEGNSNRNSYALDISLGLQQYVFFNWGMPDWSQYGPHMYAVDPRVLLLPQTVATPWDISAIAGLTDIELPYSQLSRKAQQRIQHDYYGMMLTGADWFEFIARRVIDSVHAGNPVYELRNGGVGMGEIKFPGIVGSEWIKNDYSGREQLEKVYYPSLYALGFAYEGSEQARREMVELGRTRMTDPTPEELGIDYVQAASIWNSIRG